MDLIVVDGATAKMAHVTLKKGSVNVYLVGLVYPAIIRVMLVPMEMNAAESVTVST